MNDHKIRFSDNDPRSLPQRVERILALLQQHRGASCHSCGEKLCGHSIVFSVVLGYENKPLCLNCIARDHGRDANTMRDEMVLYVHSKPCLVQGWRLANLWEGAHAEGLPECHWSEDERQPLKHLEPEQNYDSDVDLLSDARSADEFYDAGDLGCGELVLKLRIRLMKTSPGTLLELRATDPGAVEDIPSWCRLTGNPLIGADHPIYLIERKED